MRIAKWISFSSGEFRWIKLELAHEFTGKARNVSTLIVNGVRFQNSVKFMSNADTYSYTFVTIVSELGSSEWLAGAARVLR